MTERTGRMRGFTLIEILVTLVIVAILVALAVPGVNGMRERSQTVRCVSHLRTIHHGLSGYAADLGFYPGYRVTGEPVYWHQAIVPYVENAQIPKFKEPLRPWMSCPARRDAGEEIGYGYNSYFGHVPPTASDYVESFRPYWQLRPAAVQLPSQKIIAGDNKDFGAAGSYSKYQISRSGDPLNVNHPRRHTGGGNFLHVDGHVEWLTPKALTEKSKASEGRLFTPF